MLNEKVRRCKHVKTNGIQCGSPAVREGHYCYFHRQAARDFPQRRTVQQVPETVIELALIDDADGIHYALMQVMQGILNGTISGKAPGQVLYALQIMSSNFKQTSFHRQREDEYNASDLNAYEMWEKMERECEDEDRERLHKKRVEELKKLERTCCKCKKEIEEVASLEKESASSDAPSPDGEGCGTPALSGSGCEIEACEEAVVAQDGGATHSRMWRRMEHPHVRPPQNAQRRRVRGPGANVGHRHRRGMFRHPKQQDSFCADWGAAMDVRSMHGD